VELFEEIRREYRFGVGTIQGVAKKLKTHRRMVRQALASAIPPERKTPARNSLKLGPVREFIEGILQSDREAPRSRNGRRCFRIRGCARRCWIASPTVRTSSRRVRNRIVSGARWKGGRRNELRNRAGSAAAPRNSVAPASAPS